VSLVLRRREQLPDVGCVVQARVGFCGDAACCCFLLLSDTNFLLFAQNFESNTIVSSQLPINLRLSGTEISNGTCQQALFQTSSGGGSFSLESTKIDGITAPQILAASHATVATIRNVAVQKSQMTDLFVGTGESITFDASDVFVGEMENMTSIFNLEGVDSVLTLRNMTVSDCNVSLNPLVWNAVSLKGFASGTVSEVLISGNERLGHAFFAEQATMDVSSARVENNLGGRAVVSRKAVCPATRDALSVGMLFVTHQ